MNKSTESEIIIMGMKLVPLCITVGLIFVVVMILISSLTLNTVIGCAVFLIIGVISVNQLYDKRILDNVMDDQLPDEIVNDRY